MAQEEPCLRRQGEDLLDRPIELTRVAAGKIAARRAVVRHEQSVADKGRITENIGHAIGRMPGRMDCAPAQSADLNRGAVVE